jgi:hypothetical protein
MLVGTAAVAALACGGGGGGGGPVDPDNPLNIGGTYSFSETQTDSEHDISCNNAGTLVLNQTGTNFNGTFAQQGICTGPGGSVDNSGQGPITGGRISGRSISFEAPFCEYDGQASGDPVNRLSGSLDCAIVDAGETFNFAGTWQASR